MHILIISDAYPPMRTSCATQIYDLAQAFLEQNHQVSIIIPAHSQKKSVEITNADGPTVYSVRCLKTKDVGYARRTLAEFINPFIIGFHLKRNQHFVDQKIDGIAWYSPTIFWGPLVKKLKRQFNCKSYLILRDIFPGWALDLGILKKNMIYFFLKLIEQFQYAQADFIGVQSPNNIAYFKMQNYADAHKVEVLWNWIGPRFSLESSLQIADTYLAGRSIFIYAGNMGVAQNMDSLLDIAYIMRHKSDIGFIFIGRGSEKARLQKLSNSLKLKNILFFDEINNQELPSLMGQCSAGLISLNSLHQSHNIPGKFLSYVESGLPVLAVLNKGNDLSEMLQHNNIGVVLNEFTETCIGSAVQYVLELSKTGSVKQRCQALIARYFSSDIAAKQIKSRLF